MINILVPTDYSAISNNAIDYAAALAQQYKARIILFNSFTFPIHLANTLLPSVTVQELLNNNENLLRKKAKSVESAFNIEVAFESSYSFIEEELSLLIVKYSVDLVVLGMADRTLEQDLMGNTTTAVISKMKFPVLAVPLGAKFSGMKKVLFACDVLQGVSLKILSRIKQLAMELKSEVEVFYVDKTVENLKAAHTATLSVNIINDGLNGVTYSHKNVRSNAVITEIEKEIKAFNAELLIMVPKKYGFWASLVHKSKTRVMASGLDIPLLSIPL